MIVPLPYYDHEDLHKAVPPVATIASEELTRYALNQCAAIQSGTDSLTHMEAFATVRDELATYHKRNCASELGAEALKFSQQFTRQLEYMSEVPILGTDWSIDWMKIREERLHRAALRLGLRKS